LHHELHEKASHCQQGGGVRKSPHRNHRNREQCGDDNGAATADFLRKAPKHNSAQQRSETRNHRYGSDLLRREKMVLLKKGGIKILRPMAERIESEHENYQEEKPAPITRDAPPHCRLRFWFSPTFNPRRSFFDILPDINDEKCWQRSHHK